MKYYYVFGDNSSGTWSQEFSFTAAPSSGPSVTTRVVVYGGEIVYVYMWQSRVEIEHYVARCSMYIGTLSQFVCMCLFSVKICLTETIWQTGGSKNIVRMTMSVTKALSVSVFTVPFAFTVYYEHL